MKNVKAVKNSLKFKADPKMGLLTVRIGVKKLVVPVEARMLSGEGFLFLSFTSSSEIYKVDGKSMVAMDGQEDGTDAYAALNPAKRRRRGRGKGRSTVEMPDELAQLLSKLPAGHKLVAGASGYRIVKARIRTKKG